MDNLDKGWPVRGARDEDILILRTLLEATRKLQRQLERSEVGSHCLVFLRNDIYEHLVRETPDKGKDTEIDLDWSDRELFKELIRRRIVASGLLEGQFDEVWGAVFEAFVGTRTSFDYMLDRTLMRPRDFLLFIHRAIEAAINRGHARVTADDVRQAELFYSEDLLKATGLSFRMYSKVFRISYTHFLGALRSWGARRCWRCWDLRTWRQARLSGPCRCSPGSACWVSSPRTGRKPTIRTKCGTIR